MIRKKIPGDAFPNTLAHESHAPSSVQIEGEWPARRPGLRPIAGLGRVLSLLLALLGVLAMGLSGATGLAQGAVTFIPSGASWRYLDNGSDPGPAWLSANFDDAKWGTGKAKLGYGEGDEATVVRYGTNAANKYITTYFRQAFTVQDASPVAALTVRLLRDDGAVVYLNGVEVFRSNMPTGIIKQVTLAASTISGADEKAFVTNGVSPGLLREGANLLAVEVHQDSPASSDLAFDLELTATRLSFQPPFILGQPQSQTVNDGDTASFQVLASGGEPLLYQWQFEGVAVAGATNSTLQIASAHQTAAGTYSVLVANPAGSVLSTGARLTVQQPIALRSWVSGRVVNPMGSPLADVRVILAGSIRQSMLTGADGQFVFYNLHGTETYTLTAIRSNFVFTPAAQMVLGGTNLQGVSFTGLSRYQVWQQAYWNTGGGPNSPLPTADSDGDGKPDLLEYAMGSDPLQPDGDPGFGIRMVTNNGTAHPVLSLKVASGRDNVSIGVDYAENLALPKWSTVAQRPAVDLNAGRSPVPWNTLGGSSLGVDHIEPTPWGVDLHLPPAFDLGPGGVLRWWALLPGTADTLPPLPVAPERKNRAFLAGFCNFQRLPEVVRSAIDASGNPRGYLTDGLAAGRMARRIIQGGYDIIALAEVWTGEAKDVLERDLKRDYPYYVKQLDSGGPGAIGFDLQDSGLMLFSKFPFVSLPGRSDVALLGDDNIAFGPDGPFDGAGFVHFGSSCADDGGIIEGYWGGDCRANKGAGIVQVYDPKTARNFTVVFTHLNAHHNRPAQDTARHDQLIMIRRALMDICHPIPADPAVAPNRVTFPNSVIMLGDFNINGDLAKSDMAPSVDGILGARHEWFLRIGDPASWWGANFADVWEHQSKDEDVTKDWRDRGLSSGVSDPHGAGARYDYVLLHPGQATLAVQHMALALNLRWPLDGHETEVAFGTSGDEDLTDHFGIVAYIHPDLDPNLAGSSPSNAIPVIADSTSDPLAAKTVNSEVDVAGQMQWFLLPEPGTYTIGVTAPDSYECMVFSSDELSRPAIDAGSYRRLQNDDGSQKTVALTYVSPFRPLFIRVRHRNPEATGAFTLMVRRHQGVSKEDAIPLPPNAELYTNDPRGTAGGSLTRWFLLATERADSMAVDPSRLQEIWIYGEPIEYGINHQLELVDEAERPVLTPWVLTDRRVRELNWSGGDNLYLKVTPLPDAPTQVIRIGWSTDLTVVLTNSFPQLAGGPANEMMSELVISNGTDAGIWEDEESIHLSWILSANPAVTDITRRLSAADAIRSRPTGSALSGRRSSGDLVVAEIAEGQTAPVGRFFPGAGQPLIRYLPADYFVARCVESDVDVLCPDCYSTLQGRIESLPRATFMGLPSETPLRAEEDSDEYYTLRLPLTHGVRWLQFGRP